MDCPQCGKQTVKQYTNTAFMTYPIQRQYRRWCACGYRGALETTRDQTDDERIRVAWEQAQKAAAASSSADGGERAPG